MKKEIIFRMFVILIILILCFLNCTYAASSTELKNKQKDIDNQIEEAKEDLEEVNLNKSQALQEINKMTQEISGYQDEIDSLQTTLDDLNTSIKESEVKIAEAEEEYNKTQRLLDERLVTMYEAGTISYLDVLLSSESLTNFISNYYLISEVATSDTELMEKIEAQRKEIEDAKKQLEDNKNQIEVVKKNKEAKNNELKAAKQKKDVEVAKLSEEEKAIQNDLEQFEKDKRAIKNELAEIARNEAESNKGNQTVPSNPSSSGYIFPVLGLSRANINNKNYPSYPGHTGVDVNINVKGKTIVAVKDGTVVKSHAYKKGNTYYSYGECIIINHHDGTMTLYAHGAPGSRRVQEGQKVSQGQAIMTVGTTGNSSGYHLHFEVRVGGSPVNPMPYLP